MTLVTDASYKSVIFGVSLKDLTISRVCSVNLAGVYVVATILLTLSILYKNLQEFYE